VVHAAPAVNGKTGWAFLVNGATARKDTVTALLYVLEALPTTCVGVHHHHAGQARFFDDDDNGNTAPLVSRCQEIRLAAARRVRGAGEAGQAGGARTRGATDAGLVYERAVASCKGTSAWCCNGWSRGNWRRKPALLEPSTDVKATKGEHGHGGGELEAAIKAAKGRCGRPRKPCSTCRAIDASAIDDLAALDRVLTALSGHHRPVIRARALRRKGDIDAALSWTRLRGYPHRQLPELGAVVIRRGHQRRPGSRPAWPLAPPHVGAGGIARG